jgi:hypothetical protein
VEPTFSQYKLFFRGKRQRFTVQLKDGFRGSLQQRFIFRLRHQRLLVSALCNDGNFLKNISDFLEDIS